MKNLGKTFLFILVMAMLVSSISVLSVSAADYVNFSLRQTASEVQVGNTTGVEITLTASDSINTAPSTAVTPSDVKTSDSSVIEPKFENGRYYLYAKKAGAATISVYYNDVKVATRLIAAYESGNLSASYTSNYSGSDVVEYKLSTQQFEDKMVTSQDLNLTMRYQIGGDNLVKLNYEGSPMDYTTYEHTAISVHQTKGTKMLRGASSGDYAGYYVVGDSENPVSTGIKRTRGYHQFSIAMVKNPSKDHGWEIMMLLDGVVVGSLSFENGDQGSGYTNVLHQGYTSSATTTIQYKNAYKGIELTTDYSSDPEIPAVERAISIGSAITEDGYTLKNDAGETILTSDYSIIAYGTFVQGNKEDAATEWGVEELKDSNGDAITLPAEGTLTEDGKYAIRAVGSAIVPGNYTFRAYYKDAENTSVFSEEASIEIK